jgi:hypothetical protein
MVALRAHRRAGEGACVAVDSGDVVATAATDNRLFLSPAMLAIVPRLDVWPPGCLFPKGAAWTA